MGGCELCGLLQACGSSPPRLNPKNLPAVHPGSWHGGSWFFLPVFIPLCDPLLLTSSSMFCITSAIFSCNDNLCSLLETVDDKQLPHWLKSSIKP